VNAIESLITHFDKFIESKIGFVLGWIWFCILILTVATELAILV